MPAMAEVLEVWLIEGTGGGGDIHTYLATCNGFSIHSTMYGGGVRVLKRWEQKKLQANTHYLALFILARNYYEMYFGATK